MLKFKVLAEDSEFLEFSKLYEAAFANKDTIYYKLPPKKLKTRDKVVGVFQRGEMVAGYTLSNTPNTLLNNITEENKALMANDYPLDSCYDLANIWKGNVSKLLFSIIVWPRIVIDSIFFNLHRPNIIGYALTGHGRLNAYDKAKPYYIQSSKVKNGLNIFVFTRVNLIKGFMIGLKNEISKVMLIPLNRTSTSRLDEVKR